MSSFISEAPYPIGHPLSTTRSPMNDPHSLPTFLDTDAVVKPSRTVLYLPPLLSALPEELGDEDTEYESPTSESPNTVYDSVHGNGSLENVAISPPPSPRALNDKLAQLVAQLTETRLPYIDPASVALHRALHHFQPITEEYSSQPYHESFNWDDLELPEDVQGEWYCVAFRSRRKLHSDSQSLYDADRDAHAEAVLNGGLIMYWYGVPHPVTRDNLATCIWQSRAHAVAANSRPYHAKAARLAATSYEMYTLERYTLRKELGTRTLSIDRYEAPEGGCFSMQGCPASASFSGKTESAVCPASGSS